MAGERMRRRGWIVCSTFESLALAIWIGGLVVIVVAVIPAVFNSFGMEQGGRLLTRVFDGYNRLTAVAAVILVGAAGWQLWVMRNVGPSDSGGFTRRLELGRPEAVLLTAMLIVAALIAFVFGPQSVALQQQTFEAQGESAKKAALDAFFRVHRVVRGLYLLNLGLAIALLAAKVGRWVGSGSRNLVS